MSRGNAGNEGGCRSVDTSKAYGKKHRAKSRDREKRIRRKEEERERHDRKSEQHESFFQKDFPHRFNEKPLVQNARYADDAQEISDDLLINVEAVRNNESERRLHARKPESHDESDCVHGEEFVPRDWKGFGFRIFGMGMEGAFGRIRKHERDENEIDGERGRGKKPDRLQSVRREQSAEHGTDGESGSESGTDHSNAGGTFFRIEKVAYVRLRHGERTPGQSGKETSQEKKRQTARKSENGVSANAERRSEQKGALPSNAVGKRSKNNSAREHSDGKERKCHAVRE